MFGVATIPLPFYQSDTLRLSTGISWRVFNLMRDFKPDVVHVACPGLLVFGAQLYSMLLRLPLVMSYHTHIPEYVKSYTWKGLAEPVWMFIRSWTRSANLMLVTSAVMETELSRNACRSRKLALWRRGVDVDIFNPSFRSDEMRSRLSDGHPEAPLLVHIGRLGAEKNITSLREVLAANPGARLAIVGDGPHRQHLHSHFQGTPTVFTGMLTGAALSAAYASADIFVMPSETETLGFVVLEAMASGIPVVAVAAGGIPDIITRPGTTGFLYPAGDVAAASAAVAALIAAPELALAVGKAGREDVSRWGWPAASRHLREVLYSRAIRHASALRRFRGLAGAMGARRMLNVALARLVASLPTFHTLTAFACGCLVAAVAAGAPMQALEAAYAAANGLSLSLLGPLGSALGSGLHAQGVLFAVIALGGALPLVPMQPLALLAGYTFGAAGGAAVTWAGVVVASLVALATARNFGGGHLLRELLPLGEARPFLAAQLGRIATSAARGGLWRCTLAVAALRLRPLAPFSLSNYLAVEVGVRPASLALGTAIGMLPWACLYAAGGAAWRVMLQSGRGSRLLLNAADALAAVSTPAVIAAGALVAMVLILLRNALETEAERRVKMRSS